MTEPTLFEMDLPRPVPEKPKKAPRSPGWFPKTNGEMLMRGYEPPTTSYNVDGPMYSRCQACRAPIEWWVTPTGRRLPMNPMPTAETPAIAHWSTCTDPNRFRKAKSK